MAIKKKTAVEIEKEIVAETQLQVFERGLKLFREGRYSDARPIFAKAAEGVSRPLSHNARAHINMCDRRLAKPEVPLHTAEDHYNVGIERFNVRDMEGARRHLAKAVELTRSDGDKADHIYYAFAASCALLGDARGAYENLKRAIEIDPKNRTAARHDPDFAGSVQSSLHVLLYP